MADDRGFSTRDEVERLRNWRHDKAIPMLSAHEARLKVLEAEMREITDELIPKMNLLATKLDRNEAVQADAVKRARTRFTSWQKIGIGAGVALGLITLALNLLLAVSAFTN